MPKLNEIDHKPPEFMKAVNDFVTNPKGFFLISVKCTLINMNGMIY